MAAAVALGCCIASARRLARVLAPTPLDLSLLTRAVDAGAAARGAIARVLAAVLELSWEGAALAAADERDPEVRGAVLGELLTELEGRLQYGARTPRVCASIATSAGFLCASSIAPRSRVCARRRAAPRGRGPSRIFARRADGRGRRCELLRRGAPAGASRIARAGRGRRGTRSPAAGVALRYDTGRSLYQTAPPGRVRVT